MIHFKTILSHIHYLSHLSYPATFLAIISSGHILPIPESATLIILGYLSALGQYDILFLALIVVLATLSIDLVTYAISLGGSPLARALERRVHTQLLERYAKAEKEKLFLLVFASHFIPGWRFANPIISGLTKMPWKKFTWYTLLSSLIYGPLYLLIGFYFHQRILPIIKSVESLHQILLPVFLLVVLILLLIFIRYNNPDAKK